MRNQPVVNPPGGELRVGSAIADENTSFLRCGQDQKPSIGQDKLDVKNYTLSKQVLSVLQTLSTCKHTLEIPNIPFIGSN